MVRGLSVLQTLGIFCVSFVIVTSTGSFSRVPFPKDQRTDIKFPPVIRKSDSGIPDGHLRPLGHQRRSEGRAKEYNQVLHPREFWEKHVSKKLPLVFRNAVTKSGAFQNWTDEYLTESYGDIDVLIEKKKEHRESAPIRIKLSTFLDSYHHEDWYVVTVLPDELRPDIQVPDCLLCGTFKKFVQECNLWISSGGTSSVLHYDADHNIHCLFDGRKDIILIHPKYQDYLDMVKKASYSGSSYSTMDMDMINMYKNPNIAKVPWTWATIRPGDCVYLPAGYLHQVRSYGRSLAATILFTTDGDFDDSDCDDATFNYTSLADIDVTWTYKKGDKTIDMGYMNIEIIRRNLLAFSQEEDRLLKERFIYYYYDMQDKEEENIPPAEQAWAKLDKAGKGFLTRNEIINMDKEILKDFARFVDPPHGPSGGETHDEL